MPSPGLSIHYIPFYLHTPFSSGRLTDQPKITSWDWHIELGLCFLNLQGQIQRIGGGGGGGGWEGASAGVLRY